VIVVVVAGVGKLVIEVVVEAIVEAIVLIPVIVIDGDIVVAADVLEVTVLHPTNPIKITVKNKQIRKNRKYFLIIA
jgi:hypothetical protein